jgi:hypothetical protein
MIECEDAAEVAVAVVGLGPRGLNVFDFLVAMASALKTQRLCVELIDPTCGGAGLHATDQPDYLLLNTTCEQISMFPGRGTLAHYPEATGPSLYEWVTARGLKLSEDGCTMGDVGRSPRPTDFLPRRILGEYLEWFRGHIESRVPTNVRVKKRRAMVIDIIADGDVMHLHLSDGHQLPVDYAFLTIGHAQAPNWVSQSSQRSAQLIDVPFPMRERLSAISPEQTVAIAGFGLTALDVVSTLTRGRGGRFTTADDGKLRYLPIGEEPSLILYSRSGRPFRARPRVCSFDRIHHPIAFTPRGIDALRQSRGMRKLDFERDVMPLVHREMRIAYRQCQAECRGQAEAATLASRLRSDDVDMVLAQLDREQGPFDPAVALAAAGMHLAAASDYQDWLVGTLRLDLKEADCGIASSPEKAAFDILRQLRDTFRHAVDFDGLTDTSLDDFYRRVVPMLNRAVVGPQYERHQELLALLDAASRAHRSAPLPMSGGTAAIAAGFCAPRS